MENLISTPSQNQLLLTDRQEIWHCDYVGDPYPYTKFGANPSTGGLVRK